ncbi:hypothetical protein Tco_0272386 [Tanacetum coccineum]
MRSRGRRAELCEWLVKSKNEDPVGFGTISRSGIEGMGNGRGGYGGVVFSGKDERMDRLRFVAEVGGGFGSWVRGDVERDGGVRDPVSEESVGAVLKYGGYLSNGQQLVERSAQEVARLGRGGVGDAGGRGVVAGGAGGTIEGVPVGGLLRRDSGSVVVAVFLWVMLVEGGGRIAKGAGLLCGWGWVMAC